ncbi:hydroxyethylthiazole kinase [Flammeovirgaceae bacterium SG7u.111]|nr:hydroxyethylthiazole kinase [Flammeovirgaceae bacterium SG7u.132]WPO37662.1 hydroxyethylthiazole kinase [Flammeovirgaceae bacterium SG7u.111]
MKENLWQHVLTVRKKSPLVQNITNYVVMNNTANALLAIGASPIMAHAQPEVKQMIGICQSLVINIGTLDEYWVDAMLSASAEANKLGKPWVLDPVGAGATPYRDETLEKLVALRPPFIRGNASEIVALAKRNTTQTKGVDSTLQSEEAVMAASLLHEQYGSTVCISGETDIIIGEGKQIHMSNGDALMTKVTGLGCSATAIIGAFIAVIEDKVEAVAAATALMSIAGELAANNASGPGSLQVQLLDKLYNISEEEFLGKIKLTVR